MGYNSKYTGEQVEDMLDSIDFMARDESVVHLFNDEQISGIKTFYDSVKFLNKTNAEAIIDVHPYLSIKINDTNNEIIKVQPNQTVFNNHNSKLYFNGADTRPRYNNEEIALMDDIPDDYASVSEIKSQYVQIKTFDSLQSTVNNILNDYVTQTNLNNTISNYATTKQLDSIQTNVNNNYVTKTNLNDQLDKYSETAFVNSELNKKVDKQQGKQLSTEDFTTAFKTKLNSLNNYDDSEVKAAINKINQNISNAVSFVNFYEGVSHVTTLENLPINYRFIVAEISSDQSLSVSQIPSAGRELHLIVHNSSYAEMVITLPDSGKFVNTSDSTITMDPLSYVEINLISDGNIVYIKYA